NKSYATIYGSFSIVLFLFLWIYASWIIFVYGLKLCYLLNRFYEGKAAGLEAQTTQSVEENPAAEQEQKAQE
ncbi:MAG: hypothetical protein AB7U44_05730, partial [Sulfuricurvum sp.]